MSPDRKRFLDDLAAIEAPLRSEVRRYFDNSCSSFFRFEREYVDEGRPPRVGDGLCKVVVLEHILDAQVFDGDEGISVNVSAGRFMGVVLALAGDLEVLFGRLARRLLLPVRALFATGRLALRSPELLLGVLETARILDRVPVGVGNKDLEPNIKSNSISLAFVGSISQVADDKYVPMPVGSVDEVGGLRRTFERPVLLDLEAAAELLGDSQAPGVRVEEYVPTTTVLAQLYRVPTVSGLKAREAGLAAEFLAVKEALECLIEPVRQRLYRTCRDVFAAATLETVREIVPAKELASLVVASFDHLQHLVVQMATFLKTRKELIALNASRIQTVFKRLHHDANYTALGTLRTAIHQSAKADSPLAVFL